eukprot:TRINITY_DN14444_c0_g1_i8.p1 TRINITY_DN14444_c0_g1~~TRINITY_DN14444_c0_g1_i8.p1  ORF type:complete len:367 (+),score=60.38 TRINITY_DN14444_c0_g1_i8:157-1257(+)
MKSFAVASALLVGAARGCSYFTIETPEGEVVTRTMEYGGTAPLSKDVPLPWNLAKIGQGTVFSHDKSQQCDTMAQDWKGKYNHVGIGVGPQPILGEAINTEGLSVQTHTLRLSQYQKPNTTGTTNICFTDLLPYIASSFASVAEVSDALKNSVSVVGESDPDAYFHWAVTDKYHQAIVIEYVNGQLNIHNNTVRVMTNDPHFDFHLQNLNQYVWIGTSWSNQTAISVDSEIGVVPKQISHGINLGGIPGDVSPPSRFVKLFYLKQYSQMNTPPQNISDGIILATSILNTVFIPKGVVSFKSSESSYDFTEYSTLKIPSKAQFYFKSYQNNQWRMVDLNKLTFEVGKATFIPVNNGDTGIKDVTGEL